MILNHYNQLEFPTLVNWTSLFFQFYSNFIRTFGKQIVETLIRRRTGCICPTKRKICLYGFIQTKCLYGNRKL